MKRLILTLLAVFSFLMVVSAQDVDQAPPVLEDGEYEFELTAELNTSLFTFYAEEGDEVSISMTQDIDELDPFIVIIAPDGTVFAADDDSGDVGLSSLLEDLEIEETGLYTLIASSYIYIDTFFTDQWETQPEEQPYVLTIEGVSSTGDDEIADLLEGSGYVFMEDGFEETFDIDSDQQAVFFAFEGEEGDEIDIDIAVMGGDDFFNPIIHVFNEDGERIALDYGVDELELEDDGTYYVMLVDEFFYATVDYGTVAEDDVEASSGEVEVSFSQN